jgi:transcriptional regulator with XRE-family HTH domain
MIEAMNEAIASGLSVERACCRCGIHATTYANWRRRGNAGEEPFSAFLKAIEKAKADREREWLEDIRAAAKEDAKGHRQWQAAAWLLERTNAADWARPAQRVIVETVSDPEATTATKEQLIAAALKAAQSERAKRG